MKTLLQLFNEWEIQLLVLLSFTLQIFLFFTGGLRRCTTNKFLRLVIWFSYLGADTVAVYALGFLSQHEDDNAGRDTLRGTHQLAFFWAPFLLIHLGGQDTITAFAIEDNNLWLRYLLNLVVQVTLALYIFWKSTGGPNMQLVVPSILLFVTGTIKYGERTWALWCGSLKSLASSTVPAYPEWRPIDMGITCYSNIVYDALHSVQGVREVFADSILYHPSLDHSREGYEVHPNLVHKLLEVELVLMFDDIYTKAMVLRTMSGTILRCVSQISFLGAFVLFFISNKQRYNSIDTAITYALFIGGFLLEVFAIFIIMISPWTWAWLKARQCSFLASIGIGLQKKTWFWSNSMGQYNWFNYLGQFDEQSSLWKRRVMTVIRKVVNKVCGQKQEFWISKLLDTKFVEVDDEIMRCVVKWAVQYRSDKSCLFQQFPAVGPLLEMFWLKSDLRFDVVIFLLHIYTGVCLSRYSPTGTDSESTSDLARRCQTISNYLLYLVVNHPEMLPVKKSIDGLVFPTSATTKNLEYVLHGGIDILGFHKIPEPPSYCTEAHLLEIQEAWIRLLIYAAGKSPPEMHAAQLARGGELLSFVWLLMAHHLLGDVGDRIEIADIFNMEEARISVPARNRLLYDVL